MTEITFKCIACGSNGAKVLYNGKMFCVKCASLFNTCAMCKHSRTCNFETDSTPEPQFICKDNSSAGSWRLRRTDRAVSEWRANYQNLYRRPLYMLW